MPRYFEIGLQCSGATLHWMSFQMVIKLEIIIVVRVMLISDKKKFSGMAHFSTPWDVI
jgi:hypothetical protein